MSTFFYYERMIASKYEKLILYLMKKLYLERLNLCEILLYSIRNAISHGSTRPKKNDSSLPITTILDLKSIVAKRHTRCILTFARSHGHKGYMCTKYYYSCNINV